jgi:hypothetical protein
VIRGKGMLPESPLLAVPVKAAPVSFHAGAGGTPC